jgi:hypothetical protein
MQNQPRVKRRPKRASSVAHGAIADRCTAAATPNGVACLAGASAGISRKIPKRKYFKKSAQETIQPAVIKKIGR